MHSPRSPLGPAVLVAAICLPHAGSADTSQVLQAWRTNGGWLTELRQHTDGARVCTAGKAFTDPHRFGLSIVRSGPVTLITLVDQAQPPSSGGEMRFSADGRLLGSLPVIAEGPALATSEADSQRAWHLFSSLEAQPVSIAAAGREYQADLAGIGNARAQLEFCELQSKR